MIMTRVFVPLAQGCEKLEAMTQDGRIVTSRSAGTVMDFALAIIEVLPIFSNFNVQCVQNNLLL